MKMRITMLIVLGVAGLALSLPALARREGAAVPRVPVTESTFGAAREGIRVRESVSIDVIQTSAPAAKAVTDTVTLMGPGGLYPFRGDFETASAMPYGDGALPDGWTSIDVTAGPSHWHVDTYDNPGTGNGAWCGYWYPPCDTYDQQGGYGNDWYDILEFRHAVTNPAAPTTVRVQALLRHDSESGYDWTYLMRRTATNPNFEPITPPGQGLAWDGVGTETVDYTFHFAPGEYLGGEIRLAFVFDSDGSWSDEDCLYISDGGAIVDNLVVTCAGGLVATYTEDFEDGVIGPDWGVLPGQVAGNFARVWTGLCEYDPCGEHGSKQVAFIDTYPELNPEPWPPAGCGAVNTHGGFVGMDLENKIVSPVMPLPAGADGLTLAFDVYEEYPRSDGQTGIGWGWGVRSAVAPADLQQTPWHPFDVYIYYRMGAADYKRVVLNVSDRLAIGATVVQVCLYLRQITVDIDPPGHGLSPAPYFDNVRVSAYHAGGPSIYAEELYLANDAFPAAGTLNLENLGANSVRFDMARNIAARSHLRNDPGDSIWVDVVPRSGATLTAPPSMYWTLARRNPLFDTYRTLPANPVVGVRARLIGGVSVANRWRFDLPDTGMLFPGDVVQYYFSATDTRGGDVRTSTLPADLNGYGNPDPLIWSNTYTMRCLPSLVDANGVQPRVLVWNDQGESTEEDEWYNALRYDFVALGIDYDLYTTHAASSGMGNGLGGRATVAQLAGYTDILYTCGDLDRYTLSNGDYSSDAGNDLAVLNGWLGAGGRDLLLAGNHLAEDLSGAGVTANAFLASTMGLQFRDDDVSNDLDFQLSPRAVSASPNPVLRADLSWVALRGCPGPRYDRVEPLAGTTVLARYLAPDGMSTPYACAPACLNLPAGNRVVTLTNDPAWLREPGKTAAPPAVRTKLLADVLAYFDFARDPGEPLAGVEAAAFPLAVVAQPNPFNPAVTLRYALPAPGHVTMKVYDARGRLVRTLLDQAVEAAAGAVTWRGDDDRGARAASGAYFVETRAGGQVDVRKVTMVK
jgi:hypothetical protein